jgi:signal transduction histidine kinase
LKIIAFLDFFSFLAFVLALAFVLRVRRPVPGIRVPVLLGLLAAGMLAALGGALSWSGATGALAPAQDYAYVLIPAAFWLFFAFLIARGRALAAVSRNQVLAAIHAATGRDTHPDDPFGGMGELVGRVAAMLDFDSAAIFQRQGEEGFRIAATWEVPPGLLGELAGQDYHATSLAHVLESGEPLLVARTANFPDPVTRIMDRNGVASIALFPLSARSRTLGVLCFGSRARHAFSTEVVDLLAFLSRHLGELLHNSQLQAEARERSEELSRAMDSRKLFLSMVSQDLREPLVVIKGAMLVIHQFLDKTSNSDVRRAVEMASTSSRRLEKFIGDMLDLSRLDAGGVSLEFVPVDPAAELKAMGEEYREEATRKGVSLSFDLPSRLPPMEVDKVRFHQMMRNLLSNAVRFTPAGGQVTVGAETEGENIVVRVSDTGVGIPPEEITRIFDMFYRGSAGDEKQVGTGLGLPLVREVVRLHGGHIAAESVPGQGTVFKITLPRVHLPA